MLSEEDLTEPYTLYDHIFNNKSWVNGLFTKVLGPYFIYMFCIIPMMWYIINSYMGWDIMENVFINLLLAELLTNLHSFIVIVTNHCGEDLYRFNNSVEARMENFI